MANYFYLNARNEQQGPVAAEKLLENGVTKNTLVWKEGMSQWEPAGNVAELSSLFAGQQTPPPPVPPVNPPRPGAVPPPNPPRPSQPGAGDAKPDNWLVWSILTTLLCCLPLGVVAIVYAAKVDNLWNSGQREEAVKAAKNAKLFTLISLGVGVLSYILGFIFGLFSALIGY